MKTDKNKLPAEPVFIGYTDAPREIEKEMERAKPVKDTFPRPEELVFKTETERERKQTLKAWNRYVIKDHERGHRRKLSETLHEPTERLDTTILLPRRVSAWLRTKKNRAAFIRHIIVNSYEKQGK
jgi:hypothetical protein